MKRSREDYDRLIAELETDMADLEIVRRSNDRAAARLAGESEDELDVAALGFTIHNIYGVIEGYCLRIAKFFENNLDPDSWRKDLLKRMTLSIENLRPALFDRETWLRVDELRAFRHAFRHLYARPIDPVRVGALQDRVPEAVDRFVTRHRDFCAKLTMIRDGLSDED